MGKLVIWAMGYGGPKDNMYDTWCAVLSPDVASAVRRAAVEITANGDQWEQALKIQDNMW